MIDEFGWLDLYYVIFPGGDRSKLSVLEWNTSRYDLDDFARALRRTFENKNECIAWAKELAVEHSLEYVGEDSDGDKNRYLD